MADVKPISAKIIEIIDSCVRHKNLHLIYAGGDDIFFICPFSCILEVIQTVYLNIKRRIYEEQELQITKILRDLGICLFHRDVPMIHYLDNAETEL